MDISGVNLEDLIDILLILYIFVVWYKANKRIDKLEKKIEELEGRDKKCEKNL